MQLANNLIINVRASKVLIWSLLIMVSGMAGASECPSTIYNCDYYKRCVKAGAGEKHCAELHSKERYIRVQSTWKKYNDASPSEREKMIKDLQGQ